MTVKITAKLIRYYFFLMVFFWKKFLRFYQDFSQIFSKFEQFGTILFRARQNEQEH